MSCIKAITLDLFNMRLRSNKVLKESKPLDSSVEYDYDSDETESFTHTATDELESSISSDELNDLKRMAAEPLNKSTDYISLFTSITMSDSENEDDDPPYIPQKKTDKEYGAIYKYFALNEDEKRYFSKLSCEEKKKIITLKNDIEDINIERKPSIFKILECKIPLESKIEILKKYRESKTMEKSSTEYYKLQEYINGILRIPFNKYKDLDVKNTSEYIKKQIGNIIFGHDNVKIHILEILGQYISAPKSVGNVFGIYGPMGIGKTTIIKDGLSKVLQRPFNFITLGGASDASFLDGHGYTYEGSKYGKIVECLIKSRCMNPIFYFDELDKVSKTAKGEEITNLLIHLTDDSQNTNFQDKYYTGIDIDISRAIFVFSFNNLSLINPILRDRLNIIRLDGFNVNEKFTISRDFLLKNIVKEFNAQDVEFTDDCIKYIIEKYSEEQGVRELKRKIKEIVSKINLIKLSKDLLFKSQTLQEKLNTSPILITVDLAKMLLK